MHGHIAFGNASVNPSAITHAVWREDTTHPGPVIEVFTAAGSSVILEACCEDAEAAAKAVGLSKQYEAWSAPIKAAEKAAEDAEKATAKAEAKAESKAAHSHSGK